MKKNGKRAWAMLLTLALAGSLAACGQKETTQESATPKPTEEAQESVQPVEIEYRDIDVATLVQGGANIVRTTVYGVYDMEGEHPDSAIRGMVYYDMGEKKVVRIDFDEALIPFSVSGAEGWAILSEENAAALGDAVIALEKGSYPKSFTLGGLVWNGSEREEAVRYTAQVEGQETEFVDYVATQAGGDWYYANLDEGARLLNAAGETVATVEIGTKASIEHGVGFWPSELKFPGNIELIKNYVYDNGVTYDYAPNADMVQNEQGQWVVADVVTGATLAGAPNYLNLVKEAVEAIEAGTYEEVKN